ncbi:hypothetical protein Nepgr_004602 [Nepenthes gracilis]|uniref:Protein kinase domain-containing protein n=1 Tax=Nepenthes gracilis TaxID=150966 RepID=A0AAD3S1P4_NEPGR|nr:hypothetical protein Nepgr_004602 [Nepenthes gracilis]
MDQFMPRAVAVSVFMLVLLFEHSSQLETQPLSSRAERLALIRLRSSLGLRAKEWPIKSDPCLIWRGIDCRNGTVVGINISGFKRTRIGRQNPQFAVDSLANLTHLESLNASFFALPGQIPDWFGQVLGTLQVLDLHSCSVVGAIPSSLGNLSSLITLILSDNRLTGIIPSSLGQLLNLSVLDLSQNSLTGSIPESVTYLQNLSRIDISLNNLSGSIPPGIGTLSNLERLNFSRNMLSSSIPSQIGGLANLVDLDLSANHLGSSLPQELKGMTSLQKMVIGNNGLVGGLPDVLFRDLTRLEFVDLSQNSFSGAIPDALWLISSLRIVDLSGNNFTGSLPNTSLNAIATAVVLNLSNNMYYGGLSSILQRFSSIDLSGNYFEGKVPDFAPSNISLIKNCLQNATEQRTLADCASFYASKGLTFDNFGIPTETPSRKSHKRTIILGAVLGGVGLLLLVFLLLLLFLCTRKRGVTDQRGNGVGPIHTTTIPPSPEVSINLLSLGEAFTYQQLLLATGDFAEANLIKHGHSGDLFRGFLEGGIPVVIKRINLNSARKDVYFLELDFFSKVSHHRLVPLLGYCLENENEKYLVYKYMPNGDLSSSLYRKVNPNDDSLKSLDWITRLKIAIGAAEALSYLHHECTPPFVHRDVQASSILLDDKFEVRLGSLSEVCVQEGDTHQSVITRFLRLPQTSEQDPSGSQTATCAYDVYSLGKVLLELVTGKLGISASSDSSMKEWLDQTLPYINIYDKELVTKIVDPSLIYDEDLLEEVWAMAIVARSCLNPKPSRRPLMRYILKALENPLKVVREENTGSARLRPTSSRGSWNAALFGSWRQSSSDVAAVPATSITRVSGTSGSQGSGQNGGDRSSSLRRQSREIFPEPSNDHDVERQSED